MLRKIATRNRVDQVTLEFQISQGDGVEPVHDAPLRVLLADDSAAQRTLLKVILKRAGHEVIAVESADAALDILNDPMPTVVLCDWMMPGLSGPEFCQRVRALDPVHYVYILILTSLQEKEAPAHALDVGADDFLMKPVNPNELRARLRAGIRVVEMQAQLLEKNRAISEAYASIERDLMQARALQRALLPEPECSFGDLKAGFMLRSAGKVGGDMVGLFPAGPGRTGVYSLDVSGHGVASALLSARAAGMFANLTAEPGHGDGLSLAEASGVEIVAAINDRLLDEIETDLYFTVALALVDHDTGAGELVQAGHPHPLLRRADGAIELIGVGGLPVGLVPGAPYQSANFHLGPGDQLLLQSDGFVECPLPDGGMLGEEDLIKLFADATMRGAPFDVLDNLLSQLVAIAGTTDFPDDVSAVLIERAT